MIVCSTERKIWEFFNFVPGDLYEDLPISAIEQNQYPPMTFMPDLFAKSTVKSYLCSECWGDLQMVWVKDGDGIRKSDLGIPIANVFCRACGKEHRGFVSKRFVEKQITQDFDHAYRIGKYLKDEGFIQKE